MENSPVGASSETPRSLSFVGICIAIVVIIVIGGTYLLSRPYFSAPLPQGTEVQFVSSATLIGYTEQGNVLRTTSAQVPSIIKGSGGVSATAKLVTPPSSAAISTKPGGPLPVILPPQPVWHIIYTDAGGVVHDFGSGLPLGFLPSGSLLALTPLGISSIDVSNGSLNQIIAAGSPAGSTRAPIGMASAGLSLIALQNLTTHFVDVYRFDSATSQATYVGSVTVPATSIAVSGTNIFATDAAGHLITSTLSTTGLAPSGGIFFAQQ